MASFSVKPTILKHTVFLDLFLWSFLWMCISVKDNLVLFWQFFSFLSLYTPVMSYHSLGIFVFTTVCYADLSTAVLISSYSTCELQETSHCISPSSQCFFLLCCCQFLSLFHLNSCPLVLIFEPRNFENTGLTYIVECSRSIAVWWELNALYKSYKCY